jgi:hypothetical protein
MNIKPFAYCLLFIVGISVYSIECTAGSSRKPLPPLRISVAPVRHDITQDQIKPGDVIEFKISATSSIDVQKMSIEVELTGGAKLVSGDTSWNGPAGKNEEKTIFVTVRTPENGQGRIKARVIIPPSDGTRYSAAAHYVLGREVKSKPEQEHPVKKDRKGRDVIEYR